MEKRKPGRPKGSKKVHSDRLQHVWVAVEVERRVDFHPNSVELLSVSEACRRVAWNGGVTALLGGDISAIRLSLQQVKKKRSVKGPKGPRSTKVMVANGEVRFVNDIKGALFVAHSSNYSNTIRARYYEAARIVNDQLGVRKFWMSLVMTKLDARAFASHSRRSR